MTTCGYPRDKADATNKIYLEDFLWYQYCCDFTFGGAACQPSAVVSKHWLSTSNEKPHLPAPRK